MDDLLGEFPAVQYIPPQGGFHIDILTKLGEAFRFEDLESEKVDLGGVSVTVATPATLYRMKKGKPARSQKCSGSASVG